MSTYLSYHKQTKIPKKLPKSVLIDNEILIRQKTNPDDEIDNHRIVDHLKQHVGTSYVRLLGGIDRHEFLGKRKRRKLSKREFQEVLYEGNCEKGIYGDVVQGIYCGEKRELGLGLDGEKTDQNFCASPDEDLESDDVDSDVLLKRGNEDT
eukprot:TRINITY_DN1938_c0_g1_i1.p1 TRINITY_DN1938_c0_g1~~TRINITY_DN1938_c0_g1_i1.p1  ORF type:complete len:151 (+),score=35.29 TRINITY_DN1938_c0_g1_i1:262-714(+)